MFGIHGFNILYEIDNQNQPDYVEAISRTDTTQVIRNVDRGSGNRMHACLYTGEEIEMAKWIVQQEAGNGSLEHKIIIAQVLMNRLDNGYWGNSLKGVMLAKGQFPSKSNWLNKINSPDQNTEKAVELVLINGNCEDYSQGALYFYAPKYVSDQNTVNWFESLTFLFEMEGHRFFKQ